MTMLFFCRNHIFICILLWSLTANAAADDTESFKKPEERIHRIQSDLLSVQSKILALNTALLSNDNSQAVNARLSALEEEFQKLKQQLDDERRKITAQTEAYNEAITRLTDHFNTLDREIKRIHTLIEKKTKDEAAKRLPTDIANEIRSHRFATAEELIVKMEDNEKILMIVHDVYANSAGNADVLLDFAKALTKPELAHYVLCALGYEMRANGHRDPIKMIKLVQTIEREVLQKDFGLPDVMTKAQAVVDETVKDIELVATQTLQAAMYSHTYQRNVQVEILTRALDEFRPNVADTVMEKVVDATFRAIPTEKIAQNIYSNKFIKQIVSGLLALFRNLENAGDLNNNAVLIIANYIKQLREMYSYPWVGFRKRASVEKAIDKMPICAKNLFFAPIICIKNRARSEYLYAASDAYKWNADRRNIFTWGSGVPVIQGDWFAEYKDDYFYFKNKAHHDNYLYAAGVQPYDGERRFLFTWAPGGDAGDKSAWKVELDGDYCYLRNKQYDEYLYASAIFHSDKRRYAFTWIPGTSVRQTEFQWQIRGDCE